MRRVATIFLQRSGQGVISLLVLATIAFIMSHVIGDPLQVLLPATAPKSEFVQLREHLGLDQPLLDQYRIYLWQLLQGNFGNSIFWHERVTSVIASHFANTVKLAALSILVTVLVSVPLGMAAAVWRGGIFDRLVGGMAAIGQSVPSFLVALLLLQFFSVDIHLFPSSGFAKGPSAYVLPAATLVIFEAPSIVRLIRTAVIGELQAPYVTLAKIKGVSTLGIARHTFPNAAGPAVAYAGADFIRAFVTGTVVVETVFSWPGIGYLTYQAVLNKDFPVIEGVVIFIGLLYVLV